MTNLVWQRAPQPEDEYALVLTNPEEASASLPELRRLFRAVKSAKGGRRDHLSVNATQAFEQWLQDISQPLPSAAYALVSNWFLTDAKVDRETPLGDACRDFWDALFAVRPRLRLTPVEKNSEILELRFSVWWSNLEGSQGRE